MTYRISAHRPLTRRRFIKSLAAGVAAPMIIPSGVLGNDRVAAANSRLGIGFIGMGKQVGGHITSMLGQRNVQILAVCDVDTTRREHFQRHIDAKHAEYKRKNAPRCDAYVDYRELLARPDIDGVFIVTPDHWHAAMALEACRQKKDIYCEKPMTLTIGEAKTMVDAVAKSGRVFQTGSQQRSMKIFQQAVNLVRNGRLGKIKEVLVGVGETSEPCNLPAQTLRDGLDWNLWLGPAPQREYNEILCRKGLPNKYPFNPGWRNYREYSGGYVTDWGAHHFDIVQWALSMDQSGPSEIHPPAKRDDTFGVTLTYRNSPVGDEIVVQHVNQVYEYDGEDDKGKPDRVKETNGILFIGEQGKLFVNRGVIRSEPEGLLKEPLEEDAKKVPTSPGHQRNWLNCIASRQRPICEVEIGARSVTVCHLVNLAYWHHQKLMWDAKAWQFTGGNAAEANQWLARKPRTGFELPVI